MTRALLLALLLAGCESEGDGPDHIEYECQAVDCPTATSTVESFGATTTVECVWSCEEHERQTRLVWEREDGCLHVVDVVVDDCG